MNLKFLKEESCSNCGAQVRLEEVRGRHVNGEDFEYRQFKCGKKIQWSPNFGRVVLNSPCPHEPSIVRLTERRNAAVARFRALAVELDLTAMSVFNLESFLNNYLELGPEKKSVVVPATSEHPEIRRGPGGTLVAGKEKREV